MLNNLTMEFLDGDRDGFRVRIEEIPFGMQVVFTPHFRKRLVTCTAITQNPT